MTPLRITAVLTVLAAVVVLLTRVRLAKDEGAGRLAIPPAVLRLHTFAGVPAIAVWTAFLVTGLDPLGWLGLVLWGVTVVAGLLVLARRMPARGRHSSSAQVDSWGRWPGALGARPCRPSRGSDDLHLVHGRGRAVRGRLTVLVSMGSLALGGLAVAGVPSTAEAAGEHRAVNERRVIGTSVKGRDIVAYRVGNPAAKVTAVAMAVMHGDEAAPRKILRSIVEGRKVKGIDLWVIPTMNPDGLARGTRKNARGVDLNRNFPYRWADLDGSYESGAEAASEPETRAVMRFFRDIRPRYVVSYHQPLHGVDVSTKSTRRFAIRLARGLDLPRKRLVCGGVCHGTFTQWYNHRIDKRAVTVEYGSRPSRHRMRVVAPRQLVRTLGGRY